MKAAITAAKSSGKPIELLVRRGDRFLTVPVELERRAALSLAGTDAGQRRRPGSTCCWRRARAGRSERSPDRARRSCGASASASPRRGSCCSLRCWRRLLAGPVARSGALGDALVAASILPRLSSASRCGRSAAISTAAQMRRHARENNANRALVLLITALVIAGDPGGDRQRPARGKAWRRLGAGQAGRHAGAGLAASPIWSSCSALCPCLLRASAGRQGRSRRLRVSRHARRPTIWDFLYFSFTAGMSFADFGRERSPAAGCAGSLLLHCLLSFVFNIGVIAFTINALSGG